MTKQYIYTYWTECTKVIDDLRASPIFSIATLRAYCDDPVWIIDYSDADWGDYPERLNAKVVKEHPHFNHRFFPHLNDFQVKTLSRNFDVIQQSYYSEIDEVVVADADIFWLGCVDEDWDDRCHFRKGNNGCYLYRKGDRAAMQYLDMVKYHCVRGMQSPEAMEEVKAVCGYFNDEAVFSYVRELHPDLCGGDPFLYNGPIKDLADSGGIGPYKNVHLIGGYLPLEHRDVRCIFPFLVSEFRQAIHRVLPGERLPRTPVYDLEELLASGMGGVCRAMSMGLGAGGLL